MKKYILYSLSFLTITAYSQKVNIKDTITKTNAHLITEFNDSDIESMVTFYFASRIRNDNKWRGVLQDSAQWSYRMKASIEKHDKWTFVKFKNMGLYTAQSGNQYVKVYFAIKVNDIYDEGTDEVEIAIINGKWTITKVPI